MKPPDEIPRSKLEADDLAIILAVVAEAAGEPFHFRLIGDRENWVSVEVVKGAAS